jgi:hypothetical protein
MAGRLFEAGHTTAPDHMPDRAQDSACIQRGVLAFGRVDEGRPRVRAGTVEPFDTLDRRYLREALRPRPGIDRRGRVSGVDRKPRDAQMNLHRLGV